MPPVLLLALATLFWAGNFTVGEQAVRSVDPLSLTWLRWVLAALPLLVVAHLVERLGADLGRRGDAVAARRDQVDQRLRRKVTRPLDLMMGQVRERLGQRHPVAAVAVAAARGASAASLGR